MTGHRFASLAMMRKDAPHRRLQQLPMPFGWVTVSMAIAGG
jgi:hypothetical protein